MFHFDCWQYKNIKYLHKFALNYKVQSHILSTWTQVSTSAIKPTYANNTTEEL